ncbi:PAAR domain-containing protein [Sorangium sp. So ce1153]|uniref:PAAR domain-containing protein n=1 Tax=Sorangium sp. So ce1153 TaxID=3133333 RepID=UPI003F61E888
MPSLGRVGDLSQCPADSHACPKCPHPEVIGPAVHGSSDVLADSLPALRLDDDGVHLACCGPNTWKAATGAAMVYINGKPAFRIGDFSRHCGGLGQLLTGSPDILVGGPATKLISAADVAAIQALIDAGKKQEALDKTAQVLEDAGFNMSVVGDLKYDPSDKNYGSTPRKKNPTITVGESAFKDASTLVTTVAHERKHAEQWSDPAAAEAKGRDARELEAYHEEIRHENDFGTGTDMQHNNRDYAKTHFGNLSPGEQAKYQAEQDRLVGP